MLVRREDRLRARGRGGDRPHGDRAVGAVTAGLAEVAAGSVAMGLAGYLAARSDAEHYAGERRREARPSRAREDRLAGAGYDLVALPGEMDDEPNVTSTSTFQQSS